MDDNIRQTLAGYANFGGPEARTGGTYGAHGADNSMPFSHHHAYAGGQSGPCLLYTSLLAPIPTLMSSLAGLSLPFAASSLLIAVSVALETTRQLESQMTMRHYKGFLK